MSDREMRDWHTNHAIDDATSAATWVVEARDHLAQNGGYRSEDLRRILGDQSRAALVAQVEPIRQDEQAGENR